MRWIDPHPFGHFVSTLRALLADDAFRIAFAMLSALVLTGTVFYALVEGWSLFDSLYFAVIAASTVGFGDFAPQTTLGRGFTILYVLASMGLLVLVLSRIASGMVERAIADRDAEPAPRPHRRLRRRAGSTAVRRRPDEPESPAT